MTFDTLFKFEQALAEFTGAPYAVVTDGCTHALELCFRTQRIKYCQFTAYTYLSIPQMLTDLNIHHRFTDEQWVGEYNFYKTNIWDSARLLKKGMYRPGQLQCLSFGNGKPLSVGKAGAILLDDPVLYEKLSCMRSDGRDLRISPWQDQKKFYQGYHYCPTLETCQLGLEKLPFVDQEPKYHQYPDLRSLDFTV
jgi:dTDP-4-amino-4,6-dideoxygalactose transaminase